MRKTKIVCTIGPASASRETLKEMIRAGMNVARLNFSHGTYESHREMIRRIQLIRAEMKEPVAILLDTKGPEIRIGTFPAAEVELEAGAHFTFTGRPVEGSAEQVSITYPPLARSLKVGDRILADDGKLSFLVRELQDLDILCEVECGGVLRNRKSLNLPYISVDMPFLSDRDKADLLFGIEEDVDYVAASFVRCGEDVAQLRAFLKENGGERIGIISKIENAEGVENFEQILALSDGIMVARGDMGVEIPFRRIPGIQKKIIRRTCEAGKISITATHMLESMIEKTTPTRAEITDVANAVFDGTSAVMCSGETAMGAHPTLVVKTMSDIALQAEHDAEEVDLYRERVIRGNRRDAAYALSDAACTIAKDIGAGCIVAYTGCGCSAEAVSGFRNTTPIVAVTSDPKTAYRLALCWGVSPLTVPEEEASEETFARAVLLAKERGWVKEGDPVVITADVPENLCGQTSLVRIARA